MCDDPISDDDDNYDKNNEENIKTNQLRKTFENWLDNETRVIKKSLKLPKAVSELAILYSTSNDVNKKREIREIKKIDINWTVEMDADLIALAYYFAYMGNSMRSLEVNIFFEIKQQLI